MHRRPSPVGWWRFMLVVVIVVAGDASTKHAVGDRLASGSDRHIFGPFSVTNASNCGAIFGVLSRHPGFASFAGVVGIAAIVAFFVRIGGLDARLAPAFGLLAGGTASNLLERLWSGRATDLVDPRFWPAFNLADLLIVAGLASLTLISVAPRARIRPYA